MSDKELKYTTALDFLHPSALYSEIEILDIKYYYLELINAKKLNEAYVYVNEIKDQCNERLLVHEREVRDKELLKMNFANNLFKKLLNKE